MLKTKISNFKISDNKEIYLLILSLVVGLCWWLTQAIAYSPDSTTYVILSQALVGNSGYFNSYVFMRTVGYPFLMILSGLPYTDSFTVLLLFQFAMAIYMPILFYRSVNLVVGSSKFAFNCSVFLVLSLLPFIYSKAIMTEHFFMFMIFYVSYRLILFYQSETKKDLIHLGVSLTILTLIRPSANLFLILIFLHSSIFIGKHTRTWLKGLSVFFVMMIGLSASFSLNPIALPHIRGGIHQIVNQSLFYHLYLKGFYNDNEEIDAVF